jgi:hypothetical protein
MATASASRDKGPLWPSARAQVRPVRASDACAGALLACRRSAAIGGAFGKADLGLRGLGNHIKVFLIIADDDGGIALGRAVEGLPLGAALQVDDLGIVAPHQHALVLDDVAFGIERDDVGNAKAFTCDDEQVA